MTSSSSCSDVIMQQEQQQQQLMLMTYQDGGGGGAYSVLPPVGGGRLATTTTPPGEHFTHPFSITNIMSARQRQQQLLRSAAEAEEFRHDDDVKVTAAGAGFPAVHGEPPPNDVIANYPSSYHHRASYRLMPCGVLRAPYASGHVTDDRKSTAAAAPATAPSLNGGLGYDAAPHYGIVSATATTGERQPSPIQ